MSEAAVKPVKIEHWPIEHVIPYERNAKKHEKDQVRRIVAAIQRSGNRFDVPIVVTGEGVIIKGHGRRLAALELGWKTVPVICHRGISAEEAAQMRLADNRVAIGDIDTEMLKLDLESHEGLASGLDGIFDLKELELVSADAWEMKTESFVNDMDAVLTEQHETTTAVAEAATKGRVQLAKAFGFKDIPADGQRAINRLMAKAEAATGLQGDEALITFAAAL